MSLLAFGLSILSFLGFITVVFCLDRWPMWETPFTLLMFTGFIGAFLWVAGLIAFLLEKPKDKLAAIVGGAALFIGLLGYFYILPTFSF